MAIRLIITITAAPGKAVDLSDSLQARCADVMTAEPGCEQFEWFRSVVNPNTFVLLARWRDQAALDVHNGRPHAPAPQPPLQVDRGQREDYVYNRTR